MLRSSISSSETFTTRVLSDTLRVRPRIPRCVLLATVGLILAELLIARTNFMWKMAPNNGLGMLFTLEHSIIQSNPKPRVVIFGDSRSRGAFLPALMEQRMGLERGRVLNLAMGGARPFDDLKIYERNRSVLAQADAVVIGVDAWNFSRGVPPSPLYRYYANWADRLEYTGAHRFSLMRHLLFRLPDALPSFQGYVKHWIKEGRPPRPTGIDKYGRLAVDPLDNNHDKNNFKTPALRYWITHFYSDYQYSSGFEGHLVKLLTLLREDGARVYLVRLPTAGTYTTMLEQYDGDPLGQFRKNMTRVAGAWGEAVQFREFVPEDAGLSDRDFRDWGHLNNDGAVRWTEFFVRWLGTVHAGRPGGQLGSDSRTARAPAQSLN